MSSPLWIVVITLIVALVALQVVGVRALKAWGVSPSRAVIAIRAANVVAAVAAVVYAYVRMS